MNTTEQTFAERGCSLAIFERAPRSREREYALPRATAGEGFWVEAEIFAPAEESLSAAIRIRRERSTRWSDVAMGCLGANRWRGEVLLAEPGRYFYVIEAWVDPFKAWRQNLQQELATERKVDSATLREGAQLIESVVGRADALEAERLQEWAAELRTGQSATGTSLTHMALDEPLARVMTDLIGRHPDHGFATTFVKELQVVAGTPQEQLTPTQ